MNQQAAGKVDDAAGKKCCAVTEIMDDHPAGQVADHVSAPEGGADRAEHETVFFWRRRAYQQSLRRIDRSRKKGTEEADQKHDLEVRGENQQRVEERRAVARPEQHEFPSEPVSQHSPHCRGDAEACDSRQIKEGNIKTPELVVHNVKVFPQIERDERHAAAEADHCQKLRDPYEKQIFLPVDRQRDSDCVHAGDFFPLVYDFRDTEIYAEELINSNTVFSYRL